MTAQRILLGAALAGAAALSGPDASAQMPGLTAPAAAGTGLAPPPPASFGTGGAAAAPTMTQTLTAPPGLPAGGSGPGPGGTAPGAGVFGPGQTTPFGVASPPNCCGPVGGNGPIAYEIYARTGPSLIVGGGRELVGASHFGWQVGGGGRTLFFDTTNDAAWAVDIGVRYAYNGADQSRVFDVYARQPRNAQTNQLQGPDQLQPFRLRGLTRADFTYAVGRDWFLNGPATAGNTVAWNTRFGVDVGGRYGTIRADLIPVAAPDSYFRRSVTSKSITAGAHWDAEVPFGAAILFTGVRVEYGQSWNNVVPPQDGNIQDVGILLTLGVRF